VVGACLSSIALPCGQSLGQHDRFGGGASRTMPEVIHAFGVHCLLGVLSRRAHHAQSRGRLRPDLRWCRYFRLSRAPCPPDLLPSTGGGANTATRTTTDMPPLSAKLPDQIFHGHLRVVFRLMAATDPDGGNAHMSPILCWALMTSGTPNTRWRMATRVLREGRAARTAILAPCWLPLTAGEIDTSEPPRSPCARNTKALVVRRSTL